MRTWCCCGGTCCTPLHHIIDAPTPHRACVYGCGCVARYDKTILNGACVLTGKYRDSMAEVTALAFLEPVPLMVSATADGNLFLWAVKPHADANIAKAVWSAPPKYARCSYRCRLCVVRAHVMLHRVCDQRCQVPQELHVGGCCGYSEPPDAPTEVHPAKAAFLRAGLQSSRWTWLRAVHWRRHRRHSPLGAQPRLLGTPRRPRDAEGTSVGDRGAANGQPVHPAARIGRHHRWRAILTPPEPRDACGGRLLWQRRRRGICCICGHAGVVWLLASPRRWRVHPPVDAGVGDAAVWVGGWVRTGVDVRRRAAGDAGPEPSQPARAQAEPRRADAAAGAEATEGGRAAGAVQGERVVRDRVCPPISTRHGKRAASIASSWQRVAAGGGGDAGITTTSGSGREGVCAECEPACGAVYCRSLTECWCANSARCWTSN